IPLFLIRVHGMTTAEVGRFAGIAVGLGGIIGAIGTGFVCDLLRGRVKQVESKVLMTALLAAIPMLLITLLSTDRTVIVVALFALNIFVFAYVGALVTLFQDQVSADMRGLAIAVAITISNLVSLMIFLPLVGYVSDSLTPAYGKLAVGYA